MKTSIEIIHNTIPFKFIVDPSLKLVIHFECRGLLASSTGYKSTFIHKDEVKKFNSHEEICKELAKEFYEENKELLKTKKSSNQLSLF